MGAACRINPGAAHLQRMPATRRNSERRFRRSIVMVRAPGAPRSRSAGNADEIRQKDACGPWRGARTAHGDRRQWPYARESRGGGRGRACWVDKYVSRFELQTGPRKNEHRCIRSCGGGVNRQDGKSSASASRRAGGGGSGVTGPEGCHNTPATIIQSVGPDFSSPLWMVPRRAKSFFSTRKK